MIALADLDALATARLDDAKILLTAQRYEGSVYMCGYAIEIGLKARICRTLQWTEFPSSRKEFEGLSTFKTHDLDMLLRLSGQESVVKQTHFVHWNAVAVWNPESRYKPVGSATPNEAVAIVAAVEALLKVL